MVFADRSIPGDDKVVRAAGCEPFGASDTSTVRARVEQTIAIDVEQRIGCNVGKINDAVAVAIDFALVWHSIAVGVRGAQCIDIPVVWDAIAIAIGHALVWDQVSINVQGGTRCNIDGVEHAVAVAVSTLVGNTVTVNIEATAVSDVHSVIDSILITVVGQAITRWVECYEYILDTRVHPKIDVEESTLMDVAVTHDGAARRCGTKATVVDGGLVSIVRVVGAQIVPHFVSDDVDVPDVQTRWTRLWWKSTELKGTDSKGPLIAGCCEVGDPPKGRVAPSTKQVDEIERFMVLVVDPPILECSK